MSNKDVSPTTLLQVHVTGSNPQCGKTLVAAVIARALKEAGFLYVSVATSEGDVNKFLYQDEEGISVPIEEAIAKVSNVEVQVLDLCQNQGPDEDFIKQHTSVTYKL